MSDIPEDVMDEARAVVDDINLNDASAAPAIARAILAERERCAKIAIDHIRSCGPNGIAETIRAPSSNTFGMAGHAPDTNSKGPLRSRPGKKG